MQQRVIRRRRLTMLLVLGAIMSFSVLALGNDEVHPVLARYPTSSQLQQRIDEAKRFDAAAFQLAMSDFGDAIRVSRYLSGPPWPGKPSSGIPHIRRGPVLSELKTPDMWAMSFRKADKIEPGSEWVEFYQNRLDGLTIDDSSKQLQFVLIDVVLNGWHDWDGWNHEKLVELRQEFPQLHRVYAIRELRRLKVKDAGGVLLEQLVNPDIPPYLFRAVEEGVREFVAHIDSLEYLLDIYLEVDAPLVRSRMEMTIPGFSQWAGQGENARKLWLPHLESEIPFLGFEARKTYGFSVPDLFTCNDIHERWVAENDPDPDRREKARKNVRNRETVERIRQLQRQEP